VADEIAWQGETMSMFTAVTTLFLPLSFFTSVRPPSPPLPLLPPHLPPLPLTRDQYFALDDAKRVINTQEQFWAVSGPVTAVFVVATIIIVLGKEYPYSELLRVFTFKKPMSRQKLHQEEFDRRRAELMNMETEGDPAAAAGNQPPTRPPGKGWHPTSTVSTISKV